MNWTASGYIFSDFILIWLHSSKIQENPYLMRINHMVSHMD
uniref:Uncharacterized protein n=1 Tax=Anguilla anguilla TaxID=7936 RepID=A0A0E9VYL6_ANGAN